MDNLGKHLSLAYDGRITFEQLARATQRDFERMAVYLLRRWAAPAWYVLEDVAQELLLGAWQTMWSWSAAMGPSLKSFVVFGAMSRAKRELHRARGAKLSGSPDRNPGRFELPFAALVREGEEYDDRQILDRLATEADAESILIEREEAAEGVRAAVAACETDVERAVILAIAKAGGLAEGARAVYEDDAARVRLRLVSAEHAERVMMRKARAVVRRECHAAS